MPENERPVRDIFDPVLNKVIYPTTHAAGVIVAPGKKLPDALKEKQNKNDAALTTASKEIVGAINELQRESSRLNTEDAKLKANITANNNLIIGQQSAIDDIVAKNAEQDKEIKKALNPNGGYNRALYESLPGVHFNEQSGFYEVWKEDSGLDNVTEEQMELIYHCSILTANGTPLNNALVRAIIPLYEEKDNMEVPRTLPTKAYSIYYCNNVEYFRFSTNNKRYTLPPLAFQGFFKLKTLGGKYLINNNNRYFGSTKLEDADLAFTTNANIAAGNLSYVTFKKIVDNKQNDTAIALTIAKSKYALLKGTATPEEYLATEHTKEEWMKIDTDAVAKQITFNM